MAIFYRIIPANFVHIWSFGAFRLDSKILLLFAVPWMGGLPTGHS